MKMPLFIGGVLTLTAAFPACAQMDAGTPGMTSSAPANRPIPRKLILSLSSDQSGTITTDRANYQPGQSIAITFTVANLTSKPVVYDFPTGQQFDVTVTDPKGTMLWQWSRGKMFIQSLGHLSLTPGKAQAFNAVWSGKDAQGKPIAPGVYTISARLTNSTGQAVTGSILVDPDTDPNNMGVPTKTQADTGAVRQFNASPQMTASKQIAIGVPASRIQGKK